VGRVELGARRYRPSLTTPEGPSTGGGAQSRQHIRLVSPESGALVLVVGWADLRTKSAELYSYAVMERRLRGRRGAGREIDASSYLAFLARATSFFEAAHLTTTLSEARSTEPTGRSSGIVGFVAGALVVLIVLACVVLALR
jgi:hypothetical protein